MINTPYLDEMTKTVEQIMTKGKGILAADESTNTIGNKFKSINLENTEINRKNYREMLFSTQNLEKYISGVILFEETCYQTDSNNKKMVDLLKEKNIVLGIKLDKGLANLPSSNKEKSTLGLDTLEKRCEEFYNLGIKFAKWRCVIKIDEKENLPSELSMNDVAWTLARYASICQLKGLVPIVEPEILVEGDHSIYKCREVTTKVLSKLFNQLNAHGVHLNATLLKVNMAVKGSSNNEEVDNKLVGKETVKMLLDSCPVNLGGVVFLSGGQKEIEASLNLNEINIFNSSNLRMSFSFGRALQNSPLLGWNGKNENIKLGQKELIIAAERNSLAYKGELKNDVKSSEFANNNLFEKNYSY